MVLFPAAKSQVEFRRQPPALPFEPPPQALHDRDQSHPALAGSYLAACVFLAVLFEESPVGVKTEFAGLSKMDRSLLQKAAWQECQRSMRGRSK